MGGRLGSPVKAVSPDEAREDDKQEEGRKTSVDGDATPPADRLAVAVPRSTPRRVEEDPNKPRLRINAAGGFDLVDAMGQKKQLQNDVVSWLTKRNTDTLEGSLAFVPWILQQSFFESGLDEGKIVTHRGSGAVVFSDASGFTALTERLAKKTNGAELLSQCLQAFFTPLINLINAYRGDVIKFSGDALTIYFPAVDDMQGPRSKMQMPPHGSYGLPDLGPMATAVLRACACCIEIHKRLHMFDTGVDGVRLCLHIGVGCGEVTILQVGGVVPPETHVPRFEYLIAGAPIEQISIAEPLAKNGETCVSPQAWLYVAECAVEDTTRELERPDFHLLKKMDSKKYTFPCIKYCAMERDFRHLKQFKLSELNIIRRYIPSAVFKQIEGGTLTYVNEMRNISTIFISGSGIDVSCEENTQVAQDLMTSLQRICYSFEGTLNKFVIDDKGMLFLMVFGLPPLVHTDDPTRAVLACFEMTKAFKRLNVTARFGVTTGRAYCGVCGSAQRMEYTVLGDIVNLSARLMGNAAKDGVLVDEDTKRLSTRELLYTTLNPIKVKGKTAPITIFEPRLPPPPPNIGMTPTGRVHLPWYERPYRQPHGAEGFHAPEELEQQFKENVAKLCSMQDWAGVKKVNAFLGQRPCGGLHDIPPPGQTSPVPPGSPFKDGGVIVIEGQTGMGKLELAEHICNYTESHLAMLPVCASIGPRLHDMERLGVELLRSIVGVHRHLDTSLPLDDLEALTRIMPQRLHMGLAQVREAFEGQVAEEKRVPLLHFLIDIAAYLLDTLRRQTALVVVLQLEMGTSLFNKTLDAFNPFWAAVNSLLQVAMPEAVHSSERSEPPSPRQRRPSILGSTLMGSSSQMEGTAGPLVGSTLTSGSTRLAPPSLGLRKSSVLSGQAEEEQKTSTFMRGGSKVSETPRGSGVSAMPSDKSSSGKRSPPESPRSLDLPSVPDPSSQSAVDAKPIVIVIISKEADRSQAAVKTAINKGWFVGLDGLSEQNCLHYAAMHLDIPKEKVPDALQYFIAKISLGNPLYIRETIDQLRAHEQLRLVTDSHGEIEVEYDRDLDAINIAGWSQTAMVGETVCLLESLEPLHAAVVKMSTVFKSSFTLRDLAASSCSRWAGATHFDFLRLYRALQDLVKRGIIEVAPRSRRSATNVNFVQVNEEWNSQTFQMRNVLIRKVGSSMVLEGQKKVVKRQALIDRALAKALPARMEEVNTKKLEPHIPWYYENLLMAR